MKANMKYLNALAAALMVGALGSVIAADQGTTTQVKRARPGAIASMHQLPAGWTRIDPSEHKVQSGIQLAYSVSPDVAANGVSRTVNLAFSGVTSSDAKVRLSLTKVLTLVSGATEWSLPVGQSLSQVSIVVKGNGRDPGNLQYVNVFPSQNQVTNATAVEVKIEGNTLNSKPANAQLQTDNQGRKLFVMPSDK